MPDWLRYRLERKKCLQAIEELRRDFDHLNATEEEVSEYSWEMDWAEYNLAQVEQLRLIYKAERYGIEVPTDSWKKFSQTGYSYLDTITRAKIKRQIRKEQHEDWRMWIGNIGVPVITALTGIAGAIIGIIALLKK